MKKNVIFLLLAFVTLNLTARTPAEDPILDPQYLQKLQQE